MKRLIIGRLLQLTTLVGVAVAWCAPAGAIPPCPERPADATRARKEASRWWRLGKALYESRGWDDSIKAFQCSNRLVPHPFAVYNIARAADQAGRLMLALRSYRAFLRARPRAGNRVEIEAAIQRLRRKLRTMARRVSGDSDPGTGTEPAKPPRPAKPVNVRQVLGWTAIGLGVALGVAAGVLGGLAQQAKENVENADPGTPWDPEVSRDFDAARNLGVGMWVSVGLAAAALVTGVTLVVLGRGGAGTRERVRVQPIFGPGGGGLQVVGTF